MPRPARGVVRGAKCRPRPAPKRTLVVIRRGPLLSLMRNLLCCRGGIFLPCWEEGLMSVVVGGNILRIASRVVIYFFIFQMTMTQGKAWRICE